MATILIVEDDAAVRLIIKTKLHQHYSVLEACSGTEALDLLDHTHVDLLIVDIQMPAMDGVSLLHTLRETGDKRPVLILTAMTSYQYKKRSFDAGADDYMTKPVNYDELILRIRALLRRANIANENKIVAGNLIMNKNEYSTMYRNTQIDLTSKEFDLLFLMYSIIVGVIGTLILGIGMCCAMVWQGLWFIPGIIIGLASMGILAVAYPAYQKVVKKEREKIAPEIIRLTDELMK